MVNTFFLFYILLAGYRWLIHPLYIHIVWKTLSFQLIPAMFTDTWNTEVVLWSIGLRDVGWQVPLQWRRCRWLKEHRMLGKARSESKWKQWIVLEDFLDSLSCFCSSGMDFRTTFFKTSHVWAGPVDPVREMAGFIFANEKISSITTQ